MEDQHIAITALNPLFDIHVRISGVTDCKLNIHCDIIRDFLRKLFMPYLMAMQVRVPREPWYHVFYDS